MDYSTSGIMFVFPASRRRAIYFMIVGGSMEMLSGWIEDVEATIRSPQRPSSSASSCPNARRSRKIQMPYTGTRHSRIVLRSFTHIFLDFDI